MSNLINPFIAGAPVVEQRMFFGREDVFEWIQNSLTGKYSDHILVLHGQRRVGKTSVLKQLGNFLPEKYIPVFFDLQGRTHTTLDRFLWWLAREIVREVKQKLNITIQAVDKEDFTADPDFFETHFLPELRTQIGSHALLLTFDEFDNLEEAEIKEELAVPLIDYLRRLMEQPDMNFIFSIGSSGRKLENMQAAYTEFFKTALYKKISFLTNDQCEKLITQPIEGILQVERGVTSQIFNITSGHPYFTQLCCHELFSLCQRTGQLTISPNDVACILDDVVERGTVNLKFVWDEASDLEKWVLALLAASEEPLEQNALLERLKSQRVRFSYPDLASAVLHLKEKDVLNAKNGFVIDLLKRWLQKNRTLEQVREELTETNPIANRYIEIGQEFQETGQYAKAIENYVEALTVSPGHTLAQVNIGSCYLEQNNYGQAISAYEKALAMDDEEIAARSGLCNAYMAMGDDALQKVKLKDAQRSFRNVLQINAEHTEARQRLAVIEVNRAEKALKEGRDEEALEAFLEARKYLPEDGDLALRFEHAKKGKQVRVISGLLSKVEKFIEVHDWEQASKLIKTILEIDPQYEKATQMAIFIAEQERKEKLAIYLARAEKAQKNGIFDLAEAALTEYLEIAPDDKETLQKLEAVRKASRMKKIDELTKRARSLCEQEKFDDSQTVWQQLLDFAPDEKLNVKDGIEQIKTAQRRIENYLQARQAFARKNYDKAAFLFKGIIMEDENYKDAARLFTESLELQRKSHKFWQQKWFVPVTGSIIVVSLSMVLGGLFLNGRFNSPNLSEATTTIPELVVTSQSPEATIVQPKSTSTAAPLPLMWTRLAGSENFEMDTVMSIAVDPQDPEVLYAGMANSGVYKSIDGGETWLPKQKGMVDSHIASIVIDPTNSSVVYTLAIPGGAYKTNDGGENWIPASNGLSTSGGYGGNLMIIDPQDSTHLVSLIGGKLFETKDSASSWAQMTSECLLTIWSVAINPINSQEITVVHSALDFNNPCGNGILLSLDGGQTWKNKGLDSVDYSSTIAFLPITGNSLFVNSANQLYRSDDHGDTWKKTSNEQINDYVFDQKEEQRIYGIRYSDLLISNDYGKTWTKKQNITPDGIGYLLPPGNGIVFVSSPLIGIQISRDMGSTWATSNNGLGVDQLDIVSDPYNSGFIYAYKRNDGIWNETLYQSANGGKSWQMINSNGRGIVFDADGKTIYRAGTGGLLISTDQGSSWDKVPYILWDYTTGLSADPFVSGRLFINPWPDNRPDLQCTSCLFTSTDKGQFWTEILWDQGLTGSIFWNNTGEWMYSKDAFSLNGGKNWMPCLYTGYDSAISRVSSMTVDPIDGNVVYLATKGGGVFKSISNCTSWIAINIGLDSLNVNSVVINPKDPKILYAGTDSGAYITQDAGITWQKINEGLLGVNVVYAVAIDSFDNSVYTSTPYGIFKLDSK
jgi:tetratricopeptide (TPR) repeat protein/photosystem II stability/assembly factor-like uncharacterized protein